MKRTSAAVLTLLASAVLVSCAAEPPRKEVSGPAAKGPLADWSIHIVIDNLSPDQPDISVHHYCRPEGTEIMECQVYKGGEPGAKLLGMRAFVSTETYNRMPPAERQQWRRAADVFVKYKPTITGVPGDEAKDILETLSSSYTRTFALWQQQPVAQQPAVSSRASVPAARPGVAPQKQVNAQGNKTAGTPNAVAKKPQPLRPTSPQR